MEVGIYGLGRFGSFWAGELSKFFPVKGFSRSVERETPEGVKRVDEAEVLTCDALFLCTAISSMEEVLLRIREQVHPGILIIDTCSVKVFPIALMDRLLPPEIEYLGLHPMFGPDSGKSGIQGLPMVVCEGRLPESRRNRWIDTFTTMGLQVIRLSSQQHDREAAYTQGITHFIGRVLDDLHLEPSTIATLGFEKLLEIVGQTCNDPVQLFVDLQRYNPYTSAMRKGLNDSLAKVMGQLENSLDSSELARYDISRIGENNV